MSQWNRKLRAAEPKEVCFCRLCGAEIVQLSFANGTPYWTNVIFENGQRCVILGAGNNHNFKPEHDCLKIAEDALRSTESTYSEFYKKHAELAATLEQFAQLDQEVTAESPDGNIAATLARIRLMAESNFKASDAQKPGIDQTVQAARDRVELLRQGKSTIPPSEPAVGRTARVVKGRKVPVGTEGIIFWMGIDQYKDDGRRVGIEANGQKLYTSAENILII